MSVPRAWIALASRRTLAPSLVFLVATVLAILIATGRSLGQVTPARADVDLFRQLLWTGAIAALAFPLLRRAASSFGAERRAELDAMLLRPVSRAALVWGEFLGTFAALGLLLGALAITIELAVPGPGPTTQLVGPIELSAGANAQRLVAADGGKVATRPGERLRIHFATLPPGPGGSAAGRVAATIRRDDQRKAPIETDVVTATAVEHQILGRFHMDVPTPPGNGPLVVDWSVSGAAPDLVLPMTRAERIRPVRSPRLAACAWAFRVWIASGPWLALALALGRHLSAATATLLTLTLALAAAAWGGPPITAWSATGLPQALAALGAGVVYGAPRTTDIAACLVVISLALGVAARTVSTAGALARDPASPGAAV